MSADHLAQEMAIRSVWTITQWRDAIELCDDDVTLDYLDRVASMAAAAWCSPAVVLHHLKPYILNLDTSVDTPTL